MLSCLTQQQPSARKLCNDVAGAEPLDACQQPAELIAPALFSFAARSVGAPQGVGDLVLLHYF